MEVFTRKKEKKEGLSGLGAWHVNSNLCELASTHHSQRAIANVRHILFGTELIVQGSRIIFFIPMRLGPYVTLHFWYDQ